MERKKIQEDNIKTIIHSLLQHTDFKYPLEQDEYHFLGYFIEKIIDILSVYIKSDRRYQHAWRNMPWQSCLVRAREKLFRLLVMEDMKYSDLLEEDGDSMVYLLFAFYQFENGFVMTPTSRKGKLIERYLDEINRIQMMSEDEVEQVFQRSVEIDTKVKCLFPVVSSLVDKADTWINFDSNKMTTKEVIRELRHGANVRVGYVTILGNDKCPGDHFMMTDAEGRVIGWWRPESEHMVELQDMNSSLFDQSTLPEEE